MSQDDSDDETAVWVRTDPTPDGVYRATVELSDDYSLVLDQEAASAWAVTVLTQVRRAEFDAAVIRQLTTVTRDRAAAIEVVVDLRKDRAPAPTGTAPMELLPGVSQRTGEAFLKVSINGKEVGQWSLADAREHAMYVMEAVIGAELDSAYRQVLVGVVGIDDETARGAVGTLGDFWKLTDKPTIRPTSKSKKRRGKGR